jgi:hypothetical protein
VYESGATENEMPPHSTRLTSSSKASAAERAATLGVPERCVASAWTDQRAPCHHPLKTAVAAAEAVVSRISLSLSRSVWIVEQRRGGNKARGSIEKKNLEKTLANSSQLLVRVIDLIDPWYDCRSPKF